MQGDNGGGPGGRIDKAGRFTTSSVGAHLARQLPMGRLR